MKDYTQVERDNAALTIREYAFGQMNMLRTLGDEDAANNLQEAINIAIAALRGPEWVRTADKLPLHFSNTLVVMGGKITLGLYDCNCWFFYNEDKNKWEMDEYDRVTHWMPLPKLPEVEG